MKGWDLSCLNWLYTYWVSATEDTVLVQSGTKALVCAATSVTVLPCQEEAKTSHDGVVPFIRELFKITVEKTIIGNIEHLQDRLYWDLLHQLRVDIGS